MPVVTARMPAFHLWAVTGIAMNVMRTPLTPGVAEPLVFRSPDPSSGAEGAGLVPVGSREPREPHRPQICQGGSAGLPRFGNRVCAWRQAGVSLGGETAHVGDDGRRWRSPFGGCWLGGNCAGPPRDGVTPWLEAQLAQPDPRRTVTLHVRTIHPICT